MISGGSCDTGDTKNSDLYIKKYYILNIFYLNNLKHVLNGIMIILNCNNISQFLFLLFLKCSLDNIKAFQKHNCFFYQSLEKNMTYLFYLYLLLSY